MELHYEKQGSGPAVVLIAGLAGLGQFWSPVIERLAQSRTTLTFDHPGVGRSPTQAPQSIEGLVDSVLELTGSLGIEKFSVVGHSTGGLVAQALALDHAERIEKIVLSCTWAQADRRFRELFELRKRVLDTAGMAAYKTLGNLLAYPPRIYESFCPDVPATAVGDTAAMRRVIVERIDMLLNYSRLDDLPSLHVPTLVIGSSEDQIVPFAHSEQLARSISGALLVSVPGGHFPPQTETSHYIEHVGRFLKSS